MHLSGEVRPVPDQNSTASIDRADSRFGHLFCDIQMNWQEADAHAHNRKVDGITANRSIYLLLLPNLLFAEKYSANGAACE